MFLIQFMLVKVYQEHYMTIFLSNYAGEEIEIDAEKMVFPPNLQVPVVAKEGQKYLNVGMSVYHRGQYSSWAEVDFQQSDYSGIYTNGLTYCAALAIIKKNEQGQIEKVWMLHLPGGFYENAMRDLPEPWVTGQFQLIGKFGMDAFCGSSIIKEDVLQKLIKRYPDIDLSDITLFASTNNKGSLAITKSGYVGLAPDALATAASGERNDVLFTSQNDMEGDYKEEKDYFLELIKIIPEQDREKVRRVYNTLVKMGDSDYKSSTKALLYTRHFLCGSKNQEEVDEYKQKMLSIKPDCKKMKSLLMASLLVIPTVYTLPKLYRFFQHKAQRSAIVEDILAQQEKEEDFVFLDSAEENSLEDEPSWELI